MSEYKDSGQILSSKTIEAGGVEPPQDDIPVGVRRPSPFKRIVLAIVTVWLLAGIFQRYNKEVLPTHISPDETFLPWLPFEHTRTPGRGHRFLNGKRAEHIFLTVPNNESAIATSRRFATKPHIAGSDGDFDTAIDFLHLMQKELNISAPSQEPVFPAGSAASRSATLSIPSANSPSAWIDVYYPVMNTPLDRSVELLGEDGETVWSAHIEEVTEDVLDPEAGKYATAVPAFHGLSRGGEVQGKLVYANYGRKEDYDELDKKGVNLTGKLVIARYGGIFRGLKVKGAEDRGAVGCLIYSDLRDDGTVTSANGYSAYPYGPARNPTSVQRGSVQYLSVYPGDPTTPGYPAYENSTRTDGENIPKIPSLPISASTAHRLLQEIEEGGGDRTVKLVNHVDDRVIPIWNVMGVIPGHIKNEVVVVGNHRDAWVMGATDPTSGTVSTYEVLRGLGVLLKKGWKPLRTIVIASWDAEEYGLIGSTEWGEDFAEWIDEHVVAYLNLDSSVSGSRFGLSASPSLAHFVRQVAMDVQHPTDPSRTLWDARMDRGVLYGALDSEAVEAYEMEFGVPAFIHPDAQSADDQIAAKDDISTAVGALGSGSDYTVFLQRIGVASTNGGFGSTLSDPVYHYHSVFDSEAWQERFGDPGFHRHVAVAKSLGLQLLRLADAIVLPLNTTQYSLSLDSYLDKVESIASSQGFDTDFSALRSSIANLRDASESLDVEKERAELRMKRLIKRWIRTRWRRRLMCKVRKFLRKIKRWLGIGKVCPHKARLDQGTTPMYDLKVIGHGHGPRNPRLGRFASWIHEQTGERGGDHGHNPHAHSHFHKSKLAKKIMQAARRVQAVNKKLVAFERGFISEEGIKDREWYRHLGVAPGKWLGYGATTFPALTEALTMDKNVTLAAHEAKRLQKLIDALAETIKV